METFERFMWSLQIIGAFVASMAVAFGFWEPPPRLVGTMAFSGVLLGAGARWHMCKPKE